MALWMKTGSDESASVSEPVLSAALNDCCEEAASVRRFERMCRGRHLGRSLLLLMGKWS